LAGSAITKLKSRLLGRGKPAGKCGKSASPVTNSNQFTCFYPLPAALDFILAALDSAVNFLSYQGKCFADVDSRPGGSLHVNQLVLLRERFRFFHANFTVFAVVDEIEFAADEGEHRPVGLDVALSFEQPKRDVLERGVVADVVDEKNTDGVAWGRFP
jgi:hypothetical protein